MATRAGAATSSLRAKQELIRLLFGKELSRKGHNAHRLLDHSIYSYAELRSAYLERCHKLHPDKHKSQQLAKTAESTDSDSGNEKSDASHFLELQEAWNRYEEVAKMMKRVNKGNRSTGVDSNFTLFGVGCSFSDNEVEREMRIKIMDQASRGWFSAGELGFSKGCSEDDKSAKSQAQNETISLASDELFEDVSEKNVYEANEFEGCRGNGGEKPKRSLISHLIPPKRR